MLLRLTARIRSHSSSVISKKGVPELMPGALSRMSTRAEGLAEILLAGGVDRHAEGLDAGSLADRFGSFVRRLAVEIEDRDPRPRRTEGVGHRAGEHSAGADRDRHVAFE
jgi:hypothetical protein